MKSRFIVLAGVAASEKTTIGRMLASTLTWDFLDADDYHAPEHKARMEAGTALTDDDRRPWLDLLAGVITQAIADRRPAVLACSALSRRHRDALGVDPGRQVGHPRRSFGDQVVGRPEGVERVIAVGQQGLAAVGGDAHSVGEYSQRERLRERGDGVEGLPGGEHGFHERLGVG